MEEISRLISRLGREQPRNPTVIALVEAVRLYGLTTSLTQSNLLDAKSNGEKFDKKSYQRDYMRKRRHDAKVQQAGSSQAGVTQAQG